MNNFNTIYKNILEQQLTVQKVDENYIKEFSKNIQTKNKRFNLIQITKHFNEGLDWYVLKDIDQKIYSLISINLVQKGIHYISSFMTFEKGYGSILLKKILNNSYLNSNFIYLHSDWSQQESLNQYYRNPQFQLIEYPITRDDSKTVVHYFYKNFNLSNQELKQIIQKYFI